MNGTAIKAIRIALNVLATFFFAMERTGRRGLIWIDAHYPEDPDVDELISEFQEIRRQAFGPRRENAVHIPRATRW